MHVAESVLEETRCGKGLDDNGVADAKGGGSCTLQRSLLNACEALAIEVRILRQQSEACEVTSLLGTSISCYIDGVDRIERSSHWTTCAASGSVKRPRPLSSVYMSC